MTKIYWNGRRINGRFDTFKAAVRRAVRFTVRWSLISAAAYALFMAGAMFYSTDRIEASVVDNTQKKIDALKDELVVTLAKCESAGKPAEHGIITIDNNRAGTITGQDVFSIGILQFKVSTVKAFVKQRDGKDITSRDAMLLALDPEQAKALAKYAIFETTGGIYHWQKWQAKHNLGAEVSIIKKLSK
jgi:hypothetical protein